MSSRRAAGMRHLSGSPHEVSDASLGIGWRASASSGRLRGDAPMEYRSLGAFGVEVTDLDFASDLTSETAQAVVDAVVENHVGVFRGQSLSKADYDRFGRLFGDPIDFFFTPDLDP